MTRPSPAVLITGAIVIFAAARGIQRILTAMLLPALDPWTITAASLTLATLIWAPIAVRNRWWNKDAVLWRQSVPLAAVNLVIPGVAFTAAQMFLTASVTALLVATLPAVVAVLAAILLRERIAPLAGVGILAATTGVVLLILGKGGALDATNWWVGIAVTALGVLSAAVVYVAWRSLLARHPAPVILGPQLVIATCAALAAAAFLHSPASLPALTDGWVVAGLAALGTVNYVIPQLAMFWLLTRTTALRSSLANYLAPLFATVLAVPLLEQPITAVIVAGGALIIAGAALINYARARTPSTPPTTPRWTPTSSKAPSTS